MWPPLPANALTNELALKSSRLIAIRDYITAAFCPDDYDCVWDLCCDHGYLGQSLLDNWTTSDTSSHIIFVDQRAHITSQLQENLRHYSSSRCSVITQDASTLVFRSDTKNLVIIAGVGGETLINIMQGLLAVNKGCSLDFILCPVNSLYYVRGMLKQMPVYLRFENIG